jgi:hypothetical protein
MTTLLLRRIGTFAAVLLLTGMAHEANAGARRSRPVRTGETTCWNSAGTVIGCAGTGQDGELRRGEPRAYLDNGNGTISDRRTALMWEKLSDDGSIHDKDNSYTWDNAFGKIDDLNAAAFAGHTDWRLPNVFELRTIVNLAVSPPTVSSVFNDNCGPGCTVTTCSCTNSTPFWSSSTLAIDPTYAWLVFFDNGSEGWGVKITPLAVRAVRGGS